MKLVARELGVNAPLQFSGPIRRRLRFLCHRDSCGELRTWRGLIALGLGLELELSNCIAMSECMAELSSEVGWVRRAEG